MKADARFLAQTKEFWANVRTISQEVGYTNRGNKRTGALPSIRIPTLNDVRQKFKKLNLRATAIANEDDTLTDFGQRLFDYFTLRATVLNETVQGHLMRKEAAEIEFNRLKEELKPKCILPMNKQKGVCWLGSGKTPTTRAKSDRPTLISPACAKSHAGL